MLLASFARVHCSRSCTRGPQTGLPSRIVKSKELSRPDSRCSHSNLHKTMNQSSNPARNLQQLVNQSMIKRCLHAHTPAVLQGSTLCKRGVASPTSLKDWEGVTMGVEGGRPRCVSHSRPCLAHAWSLAIWHQLWLTLAMLLLLKALWLISSHCVPNPMLTAKSVCR